ncbi:MAG TPA: LytTR family DNA-binding domain-containing protein [Thermoanaerobaculia bacterium]
MPEITTLIVDDEPGSRARIRNLLKEANDVRVVAECEDGDEAMAAIEEHAPALLFLDIQMPGMDGFELLRRLDPATMPLTVFVTAYDRYAVEAFEVRALDYLVKPVVRDRFAAALARVRETLAQRGTGEWRERAQSLVTKVNRIVLRTRNRILWVPAESIDWIESAGNYARVHVGAEGHLLRETMATIQARLDPNVFVRVHRTAIVNIERVREVFPVARGEYVLLLKDGTTRVPLSRGFRAKLEFLLGDL